jgi:5-deoxy-glucuronate isomerase
MIRDDKYPLLAKSDDTSTVYQHITAQDAGWQSLNFMARHMKKNESWQHNTGDNEYGLVILAGSCSIKSSQGNWLNVGRRPDVFSGMPYAVYFSRDTEFTVTAESEELDLGCGWCRTEEDHPAQLVTPADVPIEIRGGGNATRQINGIIPPGFDCQRLVAVEVYTPSGNWSSYPPHKHDVYRTDDQGEVIEACLEETYFYKIDSPQGYAIQRVYTDDRSLDEIAVARNNDVVLVPKGYHPVAAAHGYNVYYLNFLAGKPQSLANVDDPDHAWVKDTWQTKDPRVPVVSMDMEKT